jgi:aryl-alcohol dehydrogenase-like predicted oxidoreductase
MKSRIFGRLGWTVTDVSFGAWAIGGNWGQVDDAAGMASLHKALDMGVNFIDTAQYGEGHSERLIGRVLKERGQRGGGGPVRVATKIAPSPGAWPPSPYDRCEERYSESYLRMRLEERLTNLNAEAIELLQLHTWNRAFNRDPTALAVLQKFKKEGKILGIGISTPEHDQDSLNELVRAGLLDSVQVIYNIFEQEPAAELLPLAQEKNIAIIVRVVFDEGSLTGKFNEGTTFHEDDFRRRYFMGDRLGQTVKRVEAIRQSVKRVAPGEEDNLPSVAVRFALRHPAVSTVLTGIRNLAQAEQNFNISGQPPLSDALYEELKQHAWRRSFWYGG